MDSTNQDSSSTNAEVEANGLKRKLNPKASNETAEDSPANKRRKSSRNSTSGTVRNLLSLKGVLIKLDSVDKKRYWKFREIVCLHSMFLI